MFTDMVGYTALGQRNESLSLALVEEQRKVVRPILARHQGREVKTMGDAFLVEFPNAVDALRCAYDIQRATKEFNLSFSPDRRIHIRIGVHVGEVIESQGDISGDAVNVASRIEPLAEDGGVCISRQVYDHVRGKTDLPLDSIGTRTLKNVAEPIEIYKMTMPWEREKGSLLSGLDKRRIAVLPFTNLSSNLEEGYFADGMTEELITSLSGVRQLTVIARTSVMGYKGTTKKIKEIGEELEAGSVLEGSVRKAGNRVRITAQLIDVRTDGHLWAQNYDRQLEDVFAIQSEIAEKVASELKVRLLDEEKRVIEKKPTSNSEAYVYYLRGKELVRERTEHSLRQAIGIFDKAISIDQSFARAYVGIAEGYWALVNDGYEPYEQAAPKAEVSVKKALQLDPELAEAHAILAMVYWQEDKMHDCEAEAREALELNPSVPDAYFILSNIAFIRQDADRGIKDLETCYHLDPVRPNYVERLGQFYFFLGRENDALLHWEKTTQLAPAATYRSMTEYYLSKGDVEMAMEYYEKAERLEPTHRWVTWMRGFMSAQKGDREAALAVIKEIEKKWIGATSLNDIAFIQHSLDDLDSYFAYIDRATDQHTIRYWYVMYCPLFSKGRADSRYQEFLLKIRRMIDSQ